MTIKHFEQQLLRKLIKKTKNDYYTNMTEKDVVEKYFGKVIQPLHSNKKKYSERICLVEGEKVVTSDKENAHILNKLL